MYSCTPYNLYIINESLLTLSDPPGLTETFTLRIRDRLLVSCNSTGMMGCSTKLDLLEIRMLSQYAKFSMLMPRSRAFSGSAFSNQTKADTQQAKSTELEFKRQASLLIDAMGAVKKMGRIYCNGL